MNWADIQKNVLGEYSAAISFGKARPLGAAGGFSGARFWQLETSVGQLCLRAWPINLVDVDRLKWIHDVQRHMVDSGGSVIPQLLLTRSGGTFLTWRQRFWEISRWVPGQADYRLAPSNPRLVSAMQTLAGIHRIMSTFARVGRFTAVSPALQQRSRMIQETNSRTLACLFAAVEQHKPSAAMSQASELLRLYSQCQAGVASQVALEERATVPLQVVLRDVWHDHLMFAGNVVTGVVDFGALGVDSVAVDIARLLGSLVGDHTEKWKIGLDAYQQICPLSADEFRLLPVFDATTVLLSGINWLRWLLLDARQFEQMETVWCRLGEIMIRLEHLACRE